MVRERLSSLPQIGALLESEEWNAVLNVYSREQVKKALAKELNLVREKIQAGAEKVPSSEQLLVQVKSRLEALARSGPRPVINATGVIIHTNLGRAPLATEAVAAVEGATGYCNLELDMESGGRGSRHSHVEQLLCYLTGAEAAMAVNNNAAAVMLALAVMAQGKEGVIARGQLVEIGGSFRIPEVMAQSGVRLVEVGATNRVYIEDYRRAIGPETGAIIRVHPSNYRVVGFQEEVALAELVALAREHNLPVLDDLGSGAIVDLRPYGIDEPTVQDSVEAGVDVSCFSGDKMLGGPQCGVIVGRKRWLTLLKSHPLARALRCDKLTLAALAATLGLYMQPEGWRRIPILSMLVEEAAMLETRAKKLAAQLKGLPVEVDIIAAHSPVGGGALPLHQLETRAVRLKPKRLAASELARRLRLAPIPLIGRIHEETLILDMRTLGSEQAAAVVETLSYALGENDDGR